MIVVIALWVVATVAYGYATVSAKLALPPSSDLYANTAGFQAFEFVLGKVPALLILLFTTLAFQFLFLHAEPPPVLPAFGRRLLSVTLYSGIAIAIGLLVQFMLVADVPYNPWYQRDEQLLLQFLLTRLPAVAAVVAVTLGAELWWLKSRAR